MHCTYCSGYQPPPLSSKMHFRLLDALNFSWILCNCSGVSARILDITQLPILYHLMWWLPTTTPLACISGYLMHWTWILCIGCIAGQLHSYYMFFYTAQGCVKIWSGAMERNILEQFPLHLTLAGQFEICLIYMWNIFEIYLKYIWNIFEIYLKYVWYIFEIYLKYIWNIFEIYLILYLYLYYILEQFTLHVTLAGQFEI